MANHIMREERDKSTLEIVTRKNASQVKSRGREDEIKKVAGPILIPKARERKKWKTSCLNM